MWKLPIATMSQNPPNCHRTCRVATCRDRVDAYRQSGIAAVYIFHMPKACPYFVAFILAATLPRGRDRSRPYSGHVLTDVAQRHKKTKAPRCIGRFAVWTGLEPATPCVTGRYSNQLNYHTVCLVVLRCKYKPIIPPHQKFPALFAFFMKMMLSPSLITHKLHSVTE